MNIIDKHLQAPLSAGREYMGSQEDLPFRTTGYDTEMVNSNFTPPKSRAEFYARGGIENTAKRVINRIAERKREREQIARYEEYLAAGERGAEEAYREAVQIYGEEVKKYIPPVSLFYDEKGIFLPHKYAQHAFLGMVKFLDEKEKRGQQAQEKQELSDEYRTVGGALEAGQDPRGVITDIAKQGIDPTKYSGTVSGVMTSEKDEVNKDLKDRQLRLREKDLDLQALRLAAQQGRHVDNMKSRYDSLASSYKKEIQDVQNKIREYKKGRPFKRMDMESGKMVEDYIKDADYWEIMNGLEQQLKELQIRQKNLENTGKLIFLGGGAPVKPVGYTQPAPEEDTSKPAQQPTPQPKPKTSDDDPLGIL